MAKAHVVGVGMVPFATPRTARPYDEMANEAPHNAAAAANADKERRIMIYPLLVKLPASCGCLLARVGMLDVLSRAVQG